MTRRATSDSARRWQTEIADYALPHARIRAIAALLRRYGCTSVTDVGCAAGTLRNLLPDDVDYHGVDFVDGLMLDRAARFTSADFNAADLTPIEIDTDWIVCSGVLEYVRDVPRFLSWLRDSSTRPHSRMILTYFNDAHIALRWKRARGIEAPGHPDWVPLRSRETMLNWLTDGGCRIDASYDWGRGLRPSPSAASTVSGSLNVYAADRRSRAFAHQWIFVVTMGREQPARI